MSVATYNIVKQGFVLVSESGVRRPQTDSTLFCVLTGLPRPYIVSVERDKRFTFASPLPWERGLAVRDRFF